MEINVKPKRVLSVFSLVMINVIAVDSLRTLPISAEYGFSLVFYYLVAAVIFFIPVSLVAAELSTGWPKTGGLYIWVKEAFGRHIGFFTIWLQWIYNVVWYPTILAFISSTFAYLIDPALANNKQFLIVSMITIFWLATLVNCFGMRISSWVSTAGAILGTLIPMSFIIILGALWLIDGKPEQIHFDLQSFLPDFSHLGNLVFFTAVLFGLIGMEMSAVHAEEVKNPQRDYPRALLISTLIIFTTLVLSALAIAIVVPTKDLSLVSGLIDAFGIFFTTYHLSWMIPIIAILIILGGVCGVATWIIGPTKGLLIAARDCDIPKIFQKTNKYGAPVPILLLQGVIFTALCSVFILLPSINSSYWILSALTAQLALMVYIMMFAAAIRLRYSRPDNPRAFCIPGGKLMMWLVAGIGILTCVSAILLGFVPPSQFPVGNLAFYEGFLIVGILVLSLPPFLLAKK